MGYTLFLGSLDVTCENLLGPIKRTIEIVISSLISTNETLSPMQTCELTSIPALGKKKIKNHRVMSYLHMCQSFIG